MSPAGQSPTMGSTQLPSVPGTPQTPANGVRSLLGPNPTQPATGPTPQQKIQAYMTQVRQLHLTIDALAQDHPEASEELNGAKMALANSMAKVASAITAPEGSPTTMTF